MAKEKIEWTDQQRDAIMARGSDVLVTASAGTVLNKASRSSNLCIKTQKPIYMITIFQPTDGVSSYGMTIRVNKVTIVKWPSC